MRDFRDAKTMAQTLRELLAARSVTISHSESLELISKLLGVADWNTLSALIQTERRGAGRAPDEVATCPALPIRDFVAFPSMTFPLFIGREKTKQALDLAFQHNREIVLAVQKDPAVEAPGFGDVCEVGVLARLLDIERVPDGTIVRDQRQDGAMKILVQAHRRVAIRRFIGEAGAFQAEIADIKEGPIPEAPELSAQVVAGFERYAAAPAQATGLPQTWPEVGRIRDPGRLADTIAQHMALPLDTKLGLLATLDPVARLGKILSLLHEEPEAVA